MGIGAGDLREGLSVVLHSVQRGVPDFFLQGRSDGSVFPAETMTGPGTQWMVHATPNPGVFRFECEGVARFLEGSASGCKVQLAPAGSSSVGTNWNVQDFPNPDQEAGGGFSHVSLQCQSQGDGCKSGFLSLIDKEGGTFGKHRLTFDMWFVGLAPEDSRHTAVHWEIILLPVATEGGSTDTGTGGTPTKPV